jgi:Rrf2 family cysteine metabolism transcriptional repressor
MRADYGLRAMIDLAEHYGQGTVQSAQIAARQRISDPYLDQLLTALRKAGLVHSVRGPAGGHTLARRPEDVKLAEIVVALEGPSTFVSCMQDEHTCQLGQNCAIQAIWREMEEASMRVLRTTTLAELATAQAAERSPEMYYI